MEENLRLAYLAAMDIPVWLLRGAGEHLTVAEPAAPAVAIASTRTIARNAMNVLGETKPVRAAPVVTARAPRAAATDRVAMKLTFFTAGAFLFVDETVPSSLQRSCADLLGAIAFALGGVRANAELHPFDWPPPGTSVDKAQFRDGVMGRLAKLNQTGEFQRVILMGTEPASLMLDWSASQFGARRAEPQQIAGIAVPVFVTRSSAELLADAKLKREAWRDLRPAVLR